MSSVSASFIAVIVGMLLIGAAEAQMAPAGAPGPSEATADCITVLMDASDCLSFVQAGSTLTMPEKPCCGEMKKVITNHPVCLCQMLAKNNTIGIEFDVKQAPKLPSICKVATPPVSLCSIFGVTVDAPAGAPGVAPGTSTPGVSPAGTTGSATTNGRLSGVVSLAGAGIALLPFVFAF